MTLSMKFAVPVIWGLRITWKSTYYAFLIRRVLPKDIISKLVQFGSSTQSILSIL